MVRRWKPPWCCKCEVLGIILGWSLQQSIVTSDITRVELWMLSQEEKLHPLQSRPSGASTLAIWAEEGAVVPLFAIPLGSQRYELSCYPLEFPFAWNLYAWSKQRRCLCCQVDTVCSFGALSLNATRLSCDFRCQRYSTAGPKGWDKRRRMESSHV